MFKKKNELTTSMIRKAVKKLRKNAIDFDYILIDPINGKKEYVKVVGKGV